MLPCLPWSPPFELIHPSSLRAPSPLRIPRRPCCSKQTVSCVSDSVRDGCVLLLWLLFFRLWLLRVSTGKPMFHRKPTTLRSPSRYSPWTTLHGLWITTGYLHHFCSRRTQICLVWILQDQWSSCLLSLHSFLWPRICSMLQLWTNSWWSRHGTLTTQDTYSATTSMSLCKDAVGAVQQNWKNGHDSPRSWWDRCDHRVIHSLVLSSLSSNSNMRRLHTLCSSLSRCLGPNCRPRTTMWRIILPTPVGLCLDNPSIKVLKSFQPYRFSCLLFYRFSFSPASKDEVSLKNAMRNL